MNKTIPMSIRVSTEELDAIKKAAKSEAYSSYSEFVRKTILLETNKILNKGNDINNMTSYGRDQHE